MTGLTQRGCRKAGPRSTSTVSEPKTEGEPRWTPTTVAETLAKPIAQELLFSDIPARLSYIGLDGDPRVVPVGVLVDRRNVRHRHRRALGQGRRAAGNPRVALTIDRAGMPPRTLLVRGAATIQIVDGVPEEYVTAARKIVPAEAMPSWEAGVRALYEEMAVITVSPDHVVLHDFETTSRRPSPTSSPPRADPSARPGSWGGVGPRAHPADERTRLLQRVRGLGQERPEQVEVVRGHRVELELHVDAAAAWRARRGGARPCPARPRCRPGSASADIR